MCSQMLLTVCGSIASRLETCTESGDCVSSLAVYLWKTCRVCFYHECLRCCFTSQSKSRVLWWGKNTLFWLFIKHNDCTSFCLWVVFIILSAVLFPQVFCPLKIENVTSKQRPLPARCLLMIADDLPTNWRVLAWHNNVGNKALVLTTTGSVTWSKSLPLCESLFLQV